MIEYQWPYTVHELKTWPGYFDAVAREVKTFEIRPDDRYFQVGDLLALREWSPSAKDYTPAEPVFREITYVFPGGQFGVEAGFVVLGIRPVAATAVTEP